MVVVADGAVRVAADMDPFNKGLKSGLNQAETQAKGFGQTLNNALNPKNLAGGFLAGFAGSQVISFLGDATNAAAEFNDTVSASGVIFDQELVPGLERWAEGAARAFGASKRVALDAANQMAIFGRSAGLVGEDLENFAVTLTERAGDLASMFGGTTQEAIIAVGAALRGETEPIRRYGVLLDDATLRQRAFEMGITDTITKALTPQQRVLAAQAEILDQSSIAAGNFASTAEDMKNSQQQLNAELENVTIEIGEKLLPVMVDLVHFVRDTGIPVMREFIDLLDLSNKNSADDIPILGEIEDFLNTVDEFGRGRQLRGILSFDPEIAAAAEKLGITYGEMADRIEDAIERTGKTQFRVIQNLTRDREALAESGKAWEAYTESITAQGPAIKDAATDAADGIVEAMEEAKEEAEEVARKTPGALADQLREGIDDYDKALEELAEVAANSVSDLAERQKIEGILASQELTDALNSDSTRTRLLAQELVADLTSDYELLAPGALAAGQLVNPSLSDGMFSNINLATAAGEAIRDAAGNPLVDTSWAWNAGYAVARAHSLGMTYGQSLVYNAAVAMAAAARGVLPSSEPKDPHSPLRNLPASGLAVGRLFAEGMLDSISDVHGASLALAGAAVLRGTTAFNGLPFGAEVGGAQINQYILNVEGRPPVVGTKDDVLDRWQQETSLSRDGVQ